MFGAIFFIITAIGAASCQIPFFYAIGDPFGRIVHQDAILKRLGLNDYVYLENHQYAPEEEGSSERFSLPPTQDQNRRRAPKFSHLFLTPRRDQRILDSTDFFQQKTDDDAARYSSWPDIQHVNLKDEDDAVLALFQPKPFNKIIESDDEAVRKLFRPKHEHPSDNKSDVEAFLSRIKPSSEDEVMHYPMPQFADLDVGESIRSFSDDQNHFRIGNVCDELEDGYHSSGDCSTKYFVCRTLATKPFKLGQKWDFECSSGTVFSPKLTACVHGTAGSSCPA